MVQRAVQDRSRIPAGDLPTLADTRGVGNESPAICACGDETGASHYAWRTGDGHTPIVIELSVAADRVAVAGNDFLHPLFSLGEPSRAGPAIDAAFGPAALAYARRAWVPDAPPRWTGRRVDFRDLL